RSGRVMNPLDLPGPEFLGVFVVLLIAAHLVGKLLTRVCRARHAVPTAAAPTVEPLDAAFLAGGRNRAVDAALVVLLRDDVIAVRPGGGGFVVGKGSWTSVAGLQADLFREIGKRSGDITRLRRVASVALGGIETRLGNAGLLLVAARAERACMRMAL